MQIKRTLDQRHTWKFILKDNGSWTWHVEYPDGTRAKSKRTFEELETCLADARGNGYVVRTSKDRRRPIIAMLDRPVRRER
ncbi:MAG: hypothetical protein V7640_812 [Betaproteobacteria bacterium]